MSGLELLPLVPGYSGNKTHIFDPIENDNMINYRYLFDYVFSSLELRSNIRDRDAVHCRSLFDYLERIDKPIVDFIGEYDDLELYCEKNHKNESELQIFLKNPHFSYLKRKSKICLK